MRSGKQTRFLLRFVSKKESYTPYRFTLYLQYLKITGFTINHNGFITDFLGLNNDFVCVPNLATPVKKNYFSRAKINFSTGNEK